MVLEQFAKVKQWQAPGTSADERAQERRADWRRSLRSGASVYWRDQKQKGAEEEEEHSAPQNPLPDLKEKERERERNIQLNRTPGRIHQYIILINKSKYNINI